LGLAGAIRERDRFVQKPATMLTAEASPDDAPPATPLPLQSSPENRALTTKSRHRRPFPRVLAGAAITLLLLVLAPAASSRTAAVHKAACQSSTRASHHSSRQSHCSRRHKSVKHGRKRHSTGKSPAHKPTAHKPSARVAARCEDGSLPVRSAPGVFSCADESEPGCEDGSEPTPSASGTILTCPASGQEGGGEISNECPAEGDCVAWEPPCEAAAEDESSTCTISETES
jgi:hypothetical protein